MNRIVPGLLLAGFWLLLLLQGTISLFCIVVIVLLIIGADEYCKMIDVRPRSGFERWMLNVILAGPGIAACFFPAEEVLSVMLLLCFFCLAAYFFYAFGQLNNGYELLSRYTFGLFYIGLLGGYVVLLRHQPDGGSWLVVASAITACSDSCAYFVGRRFGKRKLCPTISPNKTVEGAVGGICGGTLAAVIFCFLLLPKVNMLFLVPISILLCVIGIGGDLLESIVKRGTGTKDSGTCLAGHGGILDRVDSLLCVCPALYFLLPLLV